MSRRPIVFGQPCFDEKEVEAVVEVVRSLWIGQGPGVERFETALAEYVHNDFAVAVSSCTAALHLSLVALGIGPGDEVITTPFTFIATVNAIEHAGATPVLVDIERETLNLAPATVQHAITPRTRAIMPVHFGGHPLDVQGFHQLAEDNDIWVIEDAADAIGSIQDGVPVGGAGSDRALVCFSFYPNKNVATAEGGAILLTDRGLATRLCSLRLHGLENDAWKRYGSTTYAPSLATTAGFKYNMTDLQAAIAHVQLTKLEAFLATRQRLAVEMDSSLAGIPGVTPIDRGPSKADFRHSLHLYQVALDPSIDRDRVVERLRQNEIGAAVHYIGVNRHPYYRTRFSDQSFEVSDWASDHVMTLPLHPGMVSEDIERIGEVLEIAVKETPTRPLASHETSRI